MTEVVNHERKLIIFQLGDKEYGIPVEQVLSIERMQSMTRVPRTARYIKGVINLRGIVTPIIDLHQRFFEHGYVQTDATRIIIVKVDHFELGLIVDSANDVLDVNIKEIAPQPEVAGSVESEFIHGVVKVDNRLIILLSMLDIFSTKNDHVNLL